MRFYPAIIDRGGPGVFGVTFPDLPGCTSGGDTLEEALNMAREALALHLEGMTEDGEDIPDPSGPESLTVPGDLDIAMVAFIPATETVLRHKRINVTIDESLLARIDATAVNRSAFLAEAARRLLEGKNRVVHGRKMATARHIKRALKSS